ncbi:MAG: acyl carrier protein [Rudaea sp.]
MDGTSPRHVANTGRERQASSNAPADRGARNLLAELLDAEAAARAALVERRLVQCAASGLDADPARVEPERSLTDMGLDSLMAVGLQNAVRSDLGVAMTSPCRTPARLR